MTDEGTDREARIAAAEARQQAAFEDGGTVDERVDELDRLKAEILAIEPE